MSQIHRGLSTTMYGARFSRHEVSASNTCTKNRHVNSDTEVGELIVITGHGPNPFRRKYVPSSEWGSSNPHHCYAHKGSENPLTYPVISHPRTRGAPV
ncbi:hypothetical protein AVEN_236362-1 [Araneus ventricosus]|uniref:Uncharacterized protein n=1 Tax=Araneus ventricosus TaxID=182803 RepID=A0A4Y2IPM4_ARAVE|nr:hypothetical protein AVEN_236362-1 [Araneus ventricosus]